MIDEVGTDGRWAFYDHNSSPRAYGSGELNNGKLNIQAVSFQAFWVRLLIFFLQRVSLLILTLRLLIVA